jgi:hypothetical protein
LLFILSAMIATTVRRRQDRFERLEDEVYKLRTSVNSLEIRTKK